MIKIIKTITAIKINIPNPIPALKIPSTTEQLENKEANKIDNEINCSCFFMTSCI